MKIPPYLPAVVLAALATAACDRKAPPVVDAEALRTREEQRQGDERRMADLRELERRAAERESAAVSAENQAERSRIEAERAALNHEKARFGDVQRDADEQRRAQARAEQQRAAAERREQEKEAAAAAQVDAARSSQKLDFFYDALDPFGDWVEIEKYGYVWQPREAHDPGWRPYTDGSWAWTEYGWTWASNEKFGWATYHYGRWARVKRVGWVWVPGSEWAPAWVSWRRSENFVGWAPLPPDAYSGSGFNGAVDRDFDIGPGNYTFVPVERFGEPTYVGHVVEAERNVTIINETVNVTNITYQQVDNRTVIYNAGPEITVIDARSARPVPHLRVQRVEGQGMAVRKGNVLQMAAPLITPASKPASAPAKVREHAKASELEHGWSSATDPQGAQVAKQKIQQDAQRFNEQAARPAPAIRPMTPPVRPPVAATPQPPIPARPMTPPKATPAPLAPPQATPRPPSAQESGRPTNLTPRPPNTARPTPVIPDSEAPPAPVAPPQATPKPPVSPGGLRPSSLEPARPGSLNPRPPKTSRPAPVETPAAPDTAPPPAPKPGALDRPVRTRPSTTPDRPPQIPSEPGAPTPGNVRPEEPSAPPVETRRRQAPERPAINVPGVPAATPVPGATPGLPPGAGAVPSPLRRIPGALQPGQQP